MRSREFSEAFNRLAAAESQFFDSELLAPVTPGDQVRVRIAGVICCLRVEPDDFSGWGVFRPTSQKTARLVRTASLTERQSYLELFPRVRLILCTQTGDVWSAAAAHRGDRRFHIDGLVPIRGVEDAEQFDLVQGRFDGAHFWFETIDPAADASTAAYLRQSLRDLAAPNQLQRPGLTPEQIAAYAVPYALAAEADWRKGLEKSEGRLRTALTHAGGEFVDFLERPDSYRVTFRIGDSMHVSAVRKDDLSVQVAGICLSGRDRDFDLASLVGVIREAEVDDQVVAVGIENHGLQEEQYWRIYPRR